MTSNDTAVAAVAQSAKSHLLEEFDPSGVAEAADDRTRRLPDDRMRREAL